MSAAYVHSEYREVLGGLYGYMSHGAEPDPAWLDALATNSLERLNEEEAAEHLREVRRVLCRLEAREVAS